MLLIVNGEDFYEPVYFNVTFEAFDTDNNDIRCAYINIINDMELEGDQQTFNVSIVNAIPDNVLISDNSVAVVRIEDNNGDGVLHSNFRLCLILFECNVLPSLSLPFPPSSLPPSLPSLPSLLSPLSLLSFLICIQMLLLDFPTLL